MKEVIEAGHSRSIQPALWTRNITSAGQYSKPVGSLPGFPHFTMNYGVYALFSEKRQMRRHPLRQADL